MTYDTYFFFKFFIGKVYKIYHRVLKLYTIQEALTPGNLSIGIGISQGVRAPTGGSEPYEGSEPY